MPEPSIILFAGSDKKTGILRKYLEALAIDVYPAKNLDEVEILTRERGIRDVLVPSWRLDQKEITWLKTGKKNKSAFNRNGVRFVMVAEKEMLEDNLLAPWQHIIVLPPQIFQRGSAYESDWNPDDFVKRKLEESLSKIINSKQGLKSIEPSPSQGTKKEVTILSDDHRERVHGYKKPEETTEFDSSGLHSDIILNSKSIRDVFDRAKLVAPTEATVLITGESGTGKELVSAMIHLNSQRKEKNFLQVNCSGIARNLIESELFGYEKGAFTGALTQKKGYFETTNGGSLFLDEIGELDISMQAKLLRVLEHGEIIRVGGAHSIRVDVRIIAATNRDLKDEVKKGNFREDLFYRLNVIRIFVPPLRKRKEDIPPLFNHFMELYNKKYHKKINDISIEAKRLLINYPWPGNVRELRNLIEGFVILKQDQRIEIDDFPADVREAGLPKLDWQGSSDPLSIRTGISLKDYEREIIKANLIANSGNRKECAQKLDISERSLYRKIKLYGLDSP